MSMKVVKEEHILGEALGAEELAAINGFSKKQLTAAEVYTFAVRLCDNEVDRDGERFPAATLDQLAPLFVGKSGIFDHQWSAKGQAARIYRTEVAGEEGRVTLAGEPYAYLKGYAYMMRTAENAALIAEIEGGIKKEVSVGCAVSRALCSICGEEIGTCGHKKGERYGGSLCYAELLDATDAYEWSFVAVPAQRNAGVMKGMKQTEAWEQEALLGRKYLLGLRGETARLMGLLQPQMSPHLCQAMVAALGEPELLEAQECCRKKAAEILPVGAQLSYLGQAVAESRDGAFLI